MPSSESAGIASHARHSAGLLPEPYDPSQLPHQASSPSSLWEPHARLCLTYNICGRLL